MLAAALTAVGLSPAIALAASSARVNGAVAGLGTRKPSLRFDIAAQGTSPITAVTVTLPSGLAFSRHASDLAHGVRVTGATKEHSDVRKGLLAVTLRRASPHVVLTVKGSALTESKVLAGTIAKLVQYNATHTGDKRSFVLKLTVTVQRGPLTSIKVPVSFTFR